MALPTWRRKPVDRGSPEMYEASDQAWDVLRDAMGSTGLTRRSSDELLHAIEAASWLERSALAGRHLLVPIAKANGASWADLAAAMGVSRATAQHRHKQEVEEWEESVRRAAMPPPWEGIEPLAPMEPPVGFEPGDDDFERLPGLPAWNYKGPLEAGIRWLRAHHTEVLVYTDDGVHYVSSKSGTSSMSTSADSEEEAWRAHLGYALLAGDDPPFPDDARPGETIAGFKARLGSEGGS
ncbi:MAG: hypothetical protein GEU98_13705 [Pseudonocardiaceae bacterium]|nr:hypothetical protein [Pseudonocardiaceae bacterium]